MTSAASMLEQIVTELNQEIFEQLDEKEMGEFPIDVSYRTNGFVDIIEFMGVQIWNSDCDENFEGDVATQMTAFLIKRIEAIIGMLKKIKF